MRISNTHEQKHTANRQSLRKILESIGNVIGIEKM